MAVDTLGHLLALHVTPASAEDRGEVERLAPTMQTVTGDNVDIAYVDQGYTRCLVPAFDGASSMPGWKDALWDRFYTGAPERQRQSVERYSIVKRA